MGMRMRMRSGAWGGMFPSGVRTADKPSHLTERPGSCMETHFLNPWIHHNWSLVSSNSGEKTMNMQAKLYPLLPTAWTTPETLSSSTNKAFWRSHCSWPRSLAVFPSPCCNNLFQSFGATSLEAVLHTKYEEAQPVA